MLKKQTSHSADPIHSLSRAQANRYGVNGAILLSYMINRIKSSQNVREGRRWFYSSVADLAKNYEYLSQTAIFNARNTLTADNGPIIKGNFNRRRGDKTTWYSVHDERTLQVPEDDVLYFRVSDAVDYGVLEAILLQNLR